MSCYVTVEIIKQKLAKLHKTKNSSPFTPLETQTTQNVDEFGDIEGGQNMQMSHYHFYLFRIAQKNLPKSADSKLGFTT